jgi:hypothetical protein
VEQPGAEFTQVVSVLQKLLSPVAQILGMSLNAFRRFAIAATDIVTEIFARAGGKKQCDSGSDPDACEQKCDFSPPVQSIAFPHVVLLKTCQM